MCGGTVSSSWPNPSVSVPILEDCCHTRLPCVATKIRGAFWIEFPCYTACMAMHILEQPMSMDAVRELAKEWYGMMIKGCVDVHKKRVALGGDYHMETCELLVAEGSSHQDVWGFNIRFDTTENGELEFDSLVNIKPVLGNKSRAVEDAAVVEQATAIIREWIVFP